MSFLIKNARAVYAPGSPESTDIRISEGFITELGQGLLPLPGHQEQVIDASHCVVYPGLVKYSPPSCPVYSKGSSGRA